MARLYEYQGKQLLKAAKVPIPQGEVATTPQEVKKIAEILRDPAAFNIPTWMFNRRKDYDTGADQHLLSSSLDFAHEMDIKRMKKTKSYKGLRHQWGQPVRGQRTKSNFRKNKGKVTLGVVKKKIKSGKV